MSGWLKSVFKSVLKTGLKLAETILKPIISTFFDLKEIKEIANDPILDKDEKANEIKKIIYGSKANFKSYRFTSDFNSNYIEYRSIGDEEKNLSIKEYLDEIRPYLSDIINEHESKDEWKIEINMSINLISSKDSNEVKTMHTTSDNVDIMTGVDANDVIEELFKSNLERYQTGLEEAMSGSEFVFDCVNELHYKLRKVDLNRERSNIESPKWLKNKKATINPKNINDDRYFQYAITVALNCGKIKNHPERIKNLKPFINQYDWSDINFPSHKTEWALFEKNNKTISLNILYVPHNPKQVRHAYKSKYNLMLQNQVILLMITDDSKWHYLAVKTLFGLLRGITVNNHGDFYCLHCLDSYTTKNKIKEHGKICENHEYCKLEMPKEGSVLKSITGEKSLLMTPFVIYADLESILGKISSCENDPQISSTIKINKHTVSDYSLFTGVKSIPQNEQSAKEFHKLIIKKFKKGKVYAALKNYIWVADLADMQLISKFLDLLKI